MSKGHTTLSVQSVFNSTQYKNSGATKSLTNVVIFNLNKLPYKIMQNMNCKYILILQLQWLTINYIQLKYILCHSTKIF